MGWGRLVWVGMVLGGWLAGGVRPVFCEGTLGEIRDFVLETEPGGEARVTFSSEAGCAYLIQVGATPGGPWVDDVSTLVRAVGASTTLGTAALSPEANRAGFFRVAALGEGYVPFTIETVDAEGVVGPYTSLAFAADGDPVVAYQDFTNGDAKVARRSGGVWDLMTVDPVGFAGYENSVATSPDGRIAVSHYDTTSRTVRIAHWQNGSWAAAPLDSGRVLGESTALRFLPDGTLVVAAFERTDHELVIARLLGGSWAFETVATSVFYFVDYRPVISADVDDDGRLALAWLNASDDLNETKLEYAEETVGGWSATMVIEGGPDILQDCSLALDPTDGRPAIAYYDAESGSLRLARIDGSAWSVEVVDGGRRAGRYCSLAFRSDGMAAISYFDEQRGVLEYAESDGAGWHRRTIDASGRVGLYTSIAFGPDDLPVISYYDSTHRDLKVARGMPLP